MIHFTLHILMSTSINFSERAIELTLVSKEEKIETEYTRFDYASSCHMCVKSECYKQTRTAGRLAVESRAQFISCAVNHRSETSEEEY